MAYVAIFMAGAAPRRHKLDDANVFGRSPASDVCVDDPNVSRAHCALSRVAGGAWVLSDLRSTNGTWLEGARVRRYALRDGETFYIGDARVVFHADRFIDHRPADPHEAMELSRVLELKRGHAPPAVNSAAARVLPSPQPNVTTHRPIRATRPLAFRRAPAVPQVENDHAPGLASLLWRLARGG